MTETRLIPVLGCLMAIAKDFLLHVSPLGRFMTDLSTARLCPLTTKCCLDSMAIVNTSSACSGTRRYSPSVRYFFEELLNNGDQQESDFRCWPVAWGTSPSRCVVDGASGSCWHDHWCAGELVE